MSHFKDPFDRSAGFFAGFMAATAFFTRLPVEPHAAGAWRLGDSAWAFPLVGAGIGAVAAFTFFLAQLIGLGIWLGATLSVTASLVLTGALHEDGLADTADGFFGGRDRNEKLAILRDSRHGTYGVLAIVLSVLLRAAALAAIGDPIHAGLALIAAHAVSRATLPAVMWGLRPARPDGLGATAGTPRLSAAITAALIGSAITLAALGPGRGVIALSFAGVFVLAIGGVAWRQIGGYTGDVLGALQQIGEITILLAAAAR
jgi:adenosylcobinamide-GDP ribazoletransferase